MNETLLSLIQTPFTTKQQAEKEETLLQLLRDLTNHHKTACPIYGKIIDLAFPNHDHVKKLTDFPYLPVSLFKERLLSSVPETDIRVILQSSGTTGAGKSRIALDLTTAQLTAQAMASIVRSLTGHKRKPMLIIDAKETISKVNDADMSARAAAILGLMPFGRDYCFALRQDLTLDSLLLSSFLKQHKGEEILIYGFTHLIWTAFFPACQTMHLDFSSGLLLHSGGWKTLAAQNVDHAAFRTRAKTYANLDQVINFYGMAELPGVIFPEQETGFFTPPSFADILIRDPLTLAPCADGTPGLIQVLSALPQSFPGHALLTQDVGVIEPGPVKRFRVLGRAPKATLRGCSDVIAASSV